MRAAALSFGIALATPVLAATVLSIGGTAHAQDSGASQGCGGLVCDLGLFGMGSKPPAAPAAPPAPAVAPPAPTQPAITRAEAPGPAAREHHSRDVRRAPRHVAKPATRAALHQPTASPKTETARTTEAPLKPAAAKPAAPPRVVATQPSPAPRAASHGTASAALPLPPGMEAVSNGEALPAPPPPPQAPVVLANPYVTQSAPTQFQPVDPFYHGEP